MRVPRSAPDPLDLVTQPLQLGDDARPLIALNFDSPLLDGATGAAPLFERGGDLPQAALVPREIEYGGHAFAAPARRLPPHLGRQGLPYRLGGGLAGRHRFG